MTFQIPGTLPGINRGLHVGIPKNAHGSDSSGPDIAAANAAAFSAGVELLAKNAQKNHWYNWDTDGLVPMIWSLRGKRALGEFDKAVAHDDWRTWLIENEPNVQGQSSTTEGELLDVVKARIAGRGVLWAGFGLLMDDQFGWGDWRRISNWYLDQGGPVPNAWHIHIYATGGMGWSLQLEDFHNWMEQRGVVRPVIVSEAAAWFNWPFHSHVEVMDAIGDALLSGMAYAVFWFSSFYRSTPMTNLLVQRGEKYELSGLGKIFKEKQAQINYLLSRRRRRRRPFSLHLPYVESENQ